MKTPSSHWESEEDIVVPSDDPCTRPEIARRLSVSTRTIQRWEKIHGMPAARIGKRRIYYIWSQVVNWLVSRQRPEAKSNATEPKQRNRNS